MKHLQKIALLFSLFAMNQSLHAWTFGFINNVEVPEIISKNVKVEDEQTGAVRIVRKQYQLFQPKTIKIQIKAMALGKLKSIQPATAGQDTLTLGFGNKDDNFFRYEVGHPEHCPGGLFSSGCVTWGAWAGACLESILVDVGNGLFQEAEIVHVPTDALQNIQNGLAGIVDGVVTPLAGPIAPTPIDPLIMGTLGLITGEEQKAPESYGDIAKDVVDFVGKSLCSNRIFLIERDRKTGQLYAITRY